MTYSLLATVRNHSASISSAALQQHGIARVADSNGFGRRRQHHFNIGTIIAKDVTTVAAMMLHTQKGVKSVYSYWGSKYSNNIPRPATARQIWYITMHGSNTLSAVETEKLSWRCKASYLNSTFSSCGKHTSSSTNVVTMWMMEATPLTTNHSFCWKSKFFRQWDRFQAYLQRNPNIWTVHLFRQTS